MTFRPDYGLRIMNDGVSESTDQFFYDFWLSSLTVIGHVQYSTTVEIPYAGELHALSLDFDQRQLDQILAKASPALSTLIRLELGLDPVSPRTIDFEGEIVFTVRARLGGIQKAQREMFVPLIVQEIL